MNLPEPHHRLLTDVLAAGAPLALAGGYALEAHGLVERPHTNVDFATESAEPLERIAEFLRETLTAHGHKVTLQDTDPLAHQLTRACTASSRSGPRS